MVDRRDMDGFRRLRITAPVLSVLLTAGFLTTGAPAGPAAALTRPAIALTRPAVAVPGPSKPSGTSAQQAQDDASAARAEVDAQLQRYSDAEARVDAAVADLSAAFADAAGAEVTQDEAAAQARRARARQDAQVRALYAAGGPVTLTASVLGATSPEDALWRMSTTDRALAGLFADTSDQVDAQAHLAVLARRRADQTSVATAAQADALKALQTRAVAADAALKQAQATLAALDTKARNARAALESARQIARAEAAARAARRSAMGTVTALGIPAEYQQAYQDAAATCPGMSWTLLAGVGQIESGHGRNNGPSSAGAIGPMQFLPATFAAYAVDGDHNGKLDPWDPQDAIFTAAHYLCTAGARAGGVSTPAGVHAALFTYNHAEWYVDLVLAAQQAIAAHQAALATP